MKGNSVNRFSGIISLLVSIVLIISAQTFPERAAAAALYVNFLAVTLCIFSIIFIIGTFLSHKDLDANKKIVWIKSPRQFLYALVSLIVYVASLGFLGFFPASLIFMPVLAYLLGFKKKLQLILGTVGLLFFIYIVFVHFLSVPVPMGFLEGVI